MIDCLDGVGKDLNALPARGDDDKDMWWGRDIAIVYSFFVLGLTIPPAHPFYEKAHIYGSDAQDHRLGDYKRDGIWIIKTYNPPSLVQIIQERCK